MMKKYGFNFDVMSTPCEILIYSDDPLHAQESAKAVLAEAKRLEKKYNYFDDTSLLSQINARSKDLLDSETKTLLKRAKQYYKSTDGLFDITVATIKDNYKEATEIALLEASLAALRPFVGCEHFQVKRDKIVFDNPHTKIDLGGFVKEYAVDRAVVILKKAKITSALVNFGGDIYALGAKPDGSHFKVGIKKPDNLAKHAEVVSLYNQALTTSASYERQYKVEDKVYSHIIKTQECEGSAKSVSVISPNCVESGVFSTALMLDSSLKQSHETIIL